MERHSCYIQDAVFTVLILSIVFVLNFLIQKIFETQILIPMIFVLGVFITSWKTQGYFWGITASLLSVLAVNYAFTFPYYAIDLISPECVFSAIVMLIVAIMTGTLTTRIKFQEKMKAETDKERMRANLLRAVSHDLRTPLTTIYGSCSALIENYDSLKKEQQLKLLKEICEDSEWLVRMVENLLSVTRIDGEKVQVVKSLTVLEELIDAVLVKFRANYPKQEVFVELPDEFVSIPMDAMLIQQVLMNILENAIFHAKGMTQLGINVTLQGREILFEIYDDGCGIPQDKMKKLFTGCTGSEGEISDSKRSNMGIGLSVCSAIIKAHGGEIWAKNRDDGGAAFFFKLMMEEEYE